MTSPRPVLTLVGGPTAIIEYAGIRVLTDPTFDEPGDYPSGSVTLHKLTGPALTPEDVGRIDVVLLSHDQHPDNLDAAGRAFLARATTVLSTPAAASRIEGVHGLASWQSHAVGGVEIIAAPALHGPAGAEELSGPIDIAVLFTGAANVGRFGDSDLTLNARTAVEAARALGEAIIVPVHAEGWHHFTETIDRLEREFAYAGLADRLRVPTAGVPLPL